MAITKQFTKPNGIEGNYWRVCEIVLKNVAHGQQSYLDGSSLVLLWKNPSIRNNDGHLDECRKYENKDLELHNVKMSDLGYSISGDPNLWEVIAKAFYFKLKSQIDAAVIKSPETRNDYEKRLVDEWKGYSNNQDGI